MINVIVTYKVKPEFAETNKRNIEIFLKDFKSLDPKKFKYSVFTEEDGVTFSHHSAYENGEMQKKILNMPSFLEFQKQRDESGLNDSHIVKILSIIGSEGEL